MGILDLLLPREIEFFKHMNNQVTNFHDACITFNEFVLKIDKLKPQEIKDNILKIKELEKKGDRIERFIIKELDQTFITPLDREDICSIVVNIDNSLDLIHIVSEKIDIFQIKKAPKELINFSKLIVEMSVILQKLVGSLKDKMAAFEHIREINKLENDADILYHTTISDLFKTKDSIEIIKFKDIYEELERLANSIEFVSKIVRGILVKQG
jgi:uncharacterized protein